MYVVAAITTGTTGRAAVCCRNRTLAGVRVSAIASRTSGWVVSYSSSTSIVAPAVNPGTLNVTLSLPGTNVASLITPIASVRARSAGDGANPAGRIRSSLL